MLATFTIEAHEVGERLDHFLARKYVNQVSRTLCKQWILKGLVSPSCDPAYRVKVNDVIHVASAAQPCPPVMEPTKLSNMPLDVSYEDEHILVLNKPVGLVVHPAVGHREDTLAQMVAAHCPGHFFQSGPRAGIVHRLDKDTSGLMVVAKSDRSHMHLAAQFAAHGRDGRLERRYKTLLWGTPIPRNGTIHTFIGRHRIQRKKMVIDDGDGLHPREAITHYSVEKSFIDGRISLVTCRLETGRTHQIRVHMLSIGTPVIGDQTYAKGFETKLVALPTWAQDIISHLKHQALCAYHLSFLHPITSERLTFTCSWPPMLQNIVHCLETQIVD